MFKSSAQKWFEAKEEYQNKSLVKSINEQGQLYINISEPRPVRVTDISESRPVRVTFPQYSLLYNVVNFPQHLLSHVVTMGFQRVVDNVNLMREGNETSYKLIYEGISKKTYWSSLKIKDFSNLEVMSLINLGLGSIKIDGCPKLLVLQLHKNHLTSIAFPRDLENLTRLDLSDNNFSSQDLSCFSNLINLTELLLGCSELWKKTGHCNRFYGSLRPLQNMTKLETLCISNTDIEEGLEYLPASLKEFYYSDCLSIEDRLAPYRNFETWKNGNRNLLARVELEKLVNNLCLALTDNGIFNERKALGLKIVVFELQSKVIELKKHLGEISTQEQRNEIAQIEVTPPSWFMT